MEVVQIVPRLPPLVDGVGDYGFLLAKQLRTAHDIHTVFLVGDPAWESVKNGRPKTEGETGRSEMPEPSAMLDGFPIYRLNERSAAELLRMLLLPGMPSIVLLQYGGYGYQKRGCPVWLAGGLCAWRKGKQANENNNQKVDSNLELSSGNLQPKRRLLTMFHEVHAFGPPWSSSFWTSPVQKWIAKRLAIASDCCRTNTKLFAGVLLKISAGRSDPVATFPVFSNVGEPDNPPSLQQRKRQMIVFGGVIWRKKIYAEHIEALTRACHILRIEKIVDIGEPTGMKPDITLPVEEMGRQPASEVSRCLTESMAGFLTYFDDSLAKSSIFAAYCAHGVLPVLASRSISDPDGIRAEREYLPALEMQEPITGAQMQAVADNALGWYRKHSLAETAANLATFISAWPPSGFHA